MINEMGPEDVWEFEADIHDGKEEALSFEEEQIAECAFWGYRTR